MTSNKLTGKQRHRILNRFLRKPVLVLQYEVEGNIPENMGGYVECYPAKWWVDVPPEWLLEGVPT